MSSGHHSSKLRDQLANLGVSTLARYVSDGQLDRLQELGIEISSSAIAEFIGSEQGVDVFRNRELRLEVLMGLPKQTLQDFLLAESSAVGDALLEYNRFNWGDNKRSRAFLQLLEIEPSRLAKPTIDTVASLEVSVQQPLHRYQNWLRKQVVSELASGSAPRFLLHMPTGSGKTRTSLESLIDYVRMLADTDITLVWFAHSDELCEQAVESISRLWAKHGSESAQLIKLWGGRESVALNSGGPKFVVTSFQTAYKSLHTRDDARFALFSAIRSKCKVLVVDEAHQSTAPTYREAIELFANRNTKVLGLTATPGRHHVGQDGEETDELVSFYCNRKISIVGNEGEPLDNPIQFLTDNGILSRVERYKLNTNQDFDLSPSEVRYVAEQMEIPSSVLKKIGKNAARTNLVASHASKLVKDEGASVIVFAPSKDNAVELASLLLYKGVEARSVTGESSLASRKESIEQFQGGGVDVLVNFGVLTTGFDAPNIDAVIVARPTTSVVLYSQMIGRGLRGPSMGGTESCKIVDVVDNISNMPEADEAFRFFDEYYS